MILDRDKQKNDLGKVETFHKYSNDLCSKFENLDLKNSDTSKNSDSSNLNDKIKLKHEFDEDSIGKLGEKIQNIQIGEEKRSSVSNDLKYTVDEKEQTVPPEELVNGKQINNLSEEKPLNDEIERDSEKDDNQEDKPTVIDETKILVESKINEEDKDVGKEVGNDSTCEETDETKKDVLRSRGPIISQKCFQRPFQPYENKSYIRSHSVLHSGGKVSVAEPLGQYGPTARQWHNNFNIISEESSFYNDPIENETSEVQAISMELWQYPRFIECVDAVANEDYFRSPQEHWKDEGPLSIPSTIVQSPPESPLGRMQSPYLPPSDGDSETGSPLPYEYTGDSNTQSTSSDSTEIWNQTIQTKQKATELYKFRPILPKPEMSSCKAKFRRILDDERRVSAWAKIQSLPEKVLVEGDDDGDTQLMIVVSNKVEGQLELIYAMVERMRKIPNSLTLQNKTGLSALYLACKVLHSQPLVAAYIAEAMIEQNVDVANLTYEGGLTLLQILEHEGETHKEVLKEICALKDSFGKDVFPPYQWDTVTG